MMVAYHKECLVCFLRPYNSPHSYLLITLITSPSQRYTVQFNKIYIHVLSVMLIRVFFPFTCIGVEGGRSLCQPASCLEHFHTFPQFPQANARLIP